MQTLYDFGVEVQNIREAIDSLEIKGSRNASFVVYAYNKCNDIINEINRIIGEQQTPPESGQNGEDSLHVEFETDPEPIMEEKGEMNGEPDSGITS